MPDAAMEYRGNDFYCDVALKGLMPLKKEYESEHVLAYHHGRPYWPVHIVVIPKKHIASLATIEEADMPIMLEILNVLRTLAARVAREHGGARVLTNLGSYQDSKHLHFHVNSGEPLK